MARRISKVTVHMSIEVGDVVKTKINGKWCRATVLEFVGIHPGTKFSYVRKIGVSESGSHYPKTLKYTKDLIPLAKSDPLSASVYADYLEEHGFSEAAQCLREGFPIKESVDE